MTTDAITYALMLSLRSHISDHWGSDLYDYSGNHIREGYCPAALLDTMRYTDKDGASRIYGPCQIYIGRYQDDAMNLANHTAVPSAYIEISTNDYENIEAWRDTLYQSQEGSKYVGSGTEYPFVIGGEQSIYRRFVIKMTSYFLESRQGDLEVARMMASAKSMLEALCTSYSNLPYGLSWQMYESPNVIITDPFGERPWQSRVIMSHNRRRGGGPDNYIADIKLYVEVCADKQKPGVW